MGCEPITEEWLLSIGFDRVPSDRGPEYYEHLKRGAINLWEFNGMGIWLLNQYDTIQLTEKRHLQMLEELLRDKGQV